MAKNLTMKQKSHKLEVEKPSDVWNQDINADKEFDKVEELLQKTVSPALLSKPVIQIELSTRAVILAILAVLGFFFAKDILPIVAIIFMAFIITSAVLPIIRRLTAKGMRKGIAIALVYIALVLMVLGVVAVIVIPLVQGLEHLISEAPKYLTQLNESIDHMTSINVLSYEIDKETVRQIVTQFTEYLTNIIKDLSIITKSINGIISTVQSVFGGLFTLLSTVILSVYMVMDHDNLVDTFLNNYVKHGHRDIVRKLVLNLESKLGSWVVGQFTLCFIIGIMNFALLLLFNVPFAVPIAVFAGLMEAVPNIGPIISAVPCVIIGFIAGGPVVGLAMLIGCIIIQQLENNLIVPKIMGNAVGVRPIFVLVGILSGFSIAGVAGALLTIPIITVVMVLYEFYRDLQKLKARGIV